MYDKRIESGLHHQRGSTILMGRKKKFSKPPKSLIARANHDLFQRSFFEDQDLAIH